MSSRHSWALGVALGLALASAACDVKVGEGGGLSVDFAAGKASDEWVRTYDIKPGGHLDIININGQIEASPATGTQVEVRAIREARAGSEEASRELLKKSEMREEVTPDGVTIETPEGQGRGRGFGRAQLSVRYEVRVPPGLNMLFKTQNGEVRLENVSGARIEATTTNGGINGRGPRHHIQIGPAIADLPKLGQDVGVDDVAHENSAGRATWRIVPVSSSISARPGMASASAILRLLPASRRYSSIDSRTKAGVPRSVMKTGPFWAAFLARP